MARRAVYIEDQTRSRRDWEEAIWQELFVASWVKSCDSVLADSLARNVNFFMLPEDGQIRSDIAKSVRGPA